MDSMKSDLDLVRNIYGRHAEEFIEMEKDNPTRKFISNLIIREIANCKNKLILDAGCGAGNDTAKIARKARFIVGIDITPEMIEIARKNPARKNSKSKNLLFQVDNMEKIQFKDNSFDMITSIFSLMYVENLGKVFVEFKRVLKDGGEVLIVVPHPARRLIKFTHNYFKTGKTWFTHRKLKYFNYCHKTEDYVNCLIQNGFVIEKISEPKLTIKKFKDNYYPWHLVIRAKVRKG
jgi:ubiquinone/menaquinone biosynthesis C-methylase UbiE